MTLEVTSEAEYACALVKRTLGAHKTIMLDLQRRARPHRLVRPGDDPVQAQRQSTLVRMLSITESYCGERLIGELNAEVDPARSPVVASIWSDAAIKATNGWKDQSEAYSRWLSVKVSWTNLQHLADARNAVAHGVGRLTLRQRPDAAKIASKLKPFQIELQGDRVVLSEASLEATARECCGHIARLDLAIQLARTTQGA